VLQVLNSHGIPALALVREAAAWKRMGWATSLANVTAVTDESTLPAQLGGVIHLAALVRHSRKNPAEVYRVNIEGTLHALHLAERHRCRMVYASTSGVVGCFSSPEMVAYEDAPYAADEIAEWPYYHSKAVAERRLRERAAELGVEVVILRPPVLLGPGDHRFRSTGNLIRYLRGRLPFLVEGGMHFADVRDVAAAILRSLEHPSPRPIYHLTGTICTISEFFALAEEVSGAPAPRRTIPAGAAWWMARILAPLQVLPDPVLIEMAGHYWGTASHHAGDDLDYRSRDPSETMRDTIEWLRANHPALRTKVG
jgi:dihydroflavonol-4-reductase